MSGGPLGDTGITEEGREQARRLGQRLAAAPELVGARMYCSTLPRGRQTAEVIAAELGGPPVTEHCGLCSYHVLPEHDGKSHQELWAGARRGGGIALWRPEYEGADTWAQLVLRAGDALHEIAEENHGRTVIVVTHNETVQASLVVLGYVPFRSRMGVSVGQTSITEWATEDDTTAGGPPDWSFADWNLIRLNDLAHLENWRPA